MIFINLDDYVFDKSPTFLQLKTTREKDNLKTRSTNRSAIL